MMLKQISVFIENKSGRLAEVTKVLGDNSININGITISDTSDFGILRLIVDQPEKAEEILKSNNFTVHLADVLALELCHRPGNLATALAVLYEAQIGVEYMYPFVGTNTNVSLIIMKVDNTNKAIAVLEKSGIKVMSPNNACKL